MNEQLSLINVTLKHCNQEKKELKKDLIVMRHYLDSVVRDEKVSD